MRWTQLCQISPGPGNKTENFVMRFNPPTIMDSTRHSSGAVAQHVRSSTFGQYRNNQCAVGGKMRVWTCWRRGFTFPRAVVKHMIMPGSHIETISKMWRLGRTARHSTNDFVASSVPSPRSTTIVLWVVRTSVGILVQAENYISHRRRDEGSPTKSDTGIPSSLQSEGQISNLS